MKKEIIILSIMLLVGLSSYSQEEDIIDITNYTNEWVTSELVFDIVEATEQSLVYPESFELVRVSVQYYYKQKNRQKTLLLYLVTFYGSDSYGEVHEGVVGYLFTVDDEFVKVVKRL